MKKQTGLTLIELMVSTIILALLMAVALPSMKSMLDRGNFKPIGRSFEKAVKYARSEAINRSQTVRISPLVAPVIGPKAGVLMQSPKQTH